MMQQVNLYQPAARKPWKLFSAQMTLAIALAMSVLWMALYYFGYKDQQEMALTLRKVKLHEEEQLAKMEALQVKLKPKNKVQQLEGKLELLKAERRQKYRILNRLQDQAISNTVGFSGYLEALARQRIPELWLTRIRVHEGGEQVYLDGSALQPNLVPKYLRRLVIEKAYDGRVFQTFALTRPENEAWHVDFSIGTKIGEDESIK